MSPILNKNNGSSCGKMDSTPNPPIFCSHSLQNPPADLSGRKNSLKLRRTLLLYSTEELESSEFRMWEKQEQFFVFVSRHGTNASIEK